MLAPVLKSVGRRVRVLVVLDQEDDRHVEDRREIDRLVKVARAGRAVADVGDADGIAAETAGRHDSPGDHGQHGSEMRNHGVDASLRIAVVHVAVAAARRAGHAAEVLAENIQDRHPAADVDGHAADARREKIVIAARPRGCRPDRFLADAGIDAAENAALVIQPHQPLLGQPRQHHAAEDVEPRRFVDRCEALFGFVFHSCGSNLAVCDE